MFFGTSNQRGAIPPAEGMKAAPFFSEIKYLRLIFLTEIGVEQLFFLSYLSRPSFFYLQALAFAGLAGCQFSGPARDQVP